MNVPRQPALFLPHYRLVGHDGVPENNGRINCFSLIFLTMLSRIPGPRGPDLVHPNVLPSSASSFPVGLHGVRGGGGGGGEAVVLAAAVVVVRGGGGGGGGGAGGGGAAGGPSASSRVPHAAEHPCKRVIFRFFKRGLLRFDFDLSKGHSVYAHFSLISPQPTPSPPPCGGSSLA